MDGLRFFEVGHGDGAPGLFSRVGLAGAVGFEVFLDSGVVVGDGGAAVLDGAVFGLDFFEEVLDLGGEVCDWVC